MEYLLRYIHQLLADPEEAGGQSQRAVAVEELPRSEVAAEETRIVQAEPSCLPFQLLERPHTIAGTSAYNWGMSVMF